MIRIATSFLLALFVTLSSHSNAADEFISLFDGKTLNGWTALPGGQWSVDGGAIVGTQEGSEKRHGILVSNRSYGDFVVRFKFKSIEGNSGFYFRCEKVDHAVAVKGFQAEIEPTGAEVGGLYETLGRAWVVKPEPGNLAFRRYQAGKWNEMSVAAIGGDVAVTVNGVTTARLKDDPGAREGLLGLQLHGGQKMNVQFKDLEIKEITNPVQPVILQKIHDRSRPHPKAVEPPSFASLKLSCKPPQDAVILFGGGDLGQWEKGECVVKESVMEPGLGGMQTRRGFSDCRLHVEWRIAQPESHGNSGIYLMNQYEVQIYNSHNNHSEIYADGMAGAIYGQYPPLVNACRPAGEWEIFDIVFSAPCFDASGKLTQAATMTVHQNGILVQDHVALTGPTDHQARPPYRQQADKMPIYLQYHGDLIQFRNIWIVQQ